MNNANHANPPVKCYGDGNDNTYVIEQASNKMYVCVRRNAGGNRKGFKTMGAHRKFADAQHELCVNAARNGWKLVDE